MSAAVAQSGAEAVEAVFEVVGARSSETTLPAVSFVVGCWPLTGRVSAVPALTCRTRTTDDRQRCCTRSQQTALPLRVHQRRTAGSEAPCLVPVVGPVHRGTVGCVKRTIRTTTEVMTLPRVVEGADESPWMSHATRLRSRRRRPRRLLLTAHVSPSSASTTTTSASKPNGPSNSATSTRSRSQIVTISPCATPQPSWLGEVENEGADDGGPRPDPGDVPEQERSPPGVSVRIVDHLHDPAEQDHCCVGESDGDQRGEVSDPRGECDEDDQKGPGIDDIAYSTQRNLFRPRSSSRRYRA